LRKQLLREAALLPPRTDPSDQNSGLQLRYFSVFGEKRGQRSNAAMPAQIVFCLREAGQDLNEDWSTLCSEANDL